MEHHKVFEKFERTVTPTTDDYLTNILGVKVRKSMVPERAWHEFVDEGSAYPPVNEEYFEWISVLTAVLMSRQQFTMLELGAGTGRWLLTAAAGLKQVNPISYKLVGVEAEETHFDWMRQCFNDNNEDPDRHWLIHKPVTAEEGEVSFCMGDPLEWYGQSIVGKCEARRIRHELSISERIALHLGLRLAQKKYAKEMPCITLNSILSKFESVDLIHADIQGLEAEVFESAKELLQTKVRKVHIGTHSSEQEERLDRLFRGMNWNPVYRFECQKTQETPMGEIKFVDGIHNWENTSLRL